MKRQGVRKIHDWDLDKRWLIFTAVFHETAQNLSRKKAINMSR